MKNYSNIDAKMKGHDIMGFFSRLLGLEDDSDNSKNISQSPVQTQITPDPSSSLTDDNFLNIHSDIKDLLWIADGVKQNWDNNISHEKYSYEMGDIEFTIRFSFDEEPSLIYTNLPIKFDVKIDEVERPPYYPNYKNLTSEQKGVYWKLLSNPYNPKINIGFVFILYYGLERYLCGDKFAQAFDVILKLREVHNNESFQAYSASALILCSMFKNRKDLLQRFFSSCTKNGAMNISDNLYFLCKLGLNIPLTGEEIIARYKTFGFTKNNYIKSYRDLFLATLKEKIYLKHKSDNVYLSEFIGQGMLSKLDRYSELIFANVSIENREIQIPMILSCKALKDDIFSLLNKTHETVKVKLAEARKAGTPIPATTISKASETVITFDNLAEEELLKRYANTVQNAIDKHFLLIELQNFYYRYRDLDDKYLTLCEKYCWEDINALKELDEAYYMQEKERNYIIGHNIDQTPKFFDANIPAFYRLAVMYEKNKNYDKAINICKMAIERYDSVGNYEGYNSFSARKIKLEKKANL